MSFQVSPKNKQRPSKASEKRKSSDKVSISVTKADNDDNSKNKMGVIMEEKEKNKDNLIEESEIKLEKKLLLPEDMTNESSDGEVIPTRNAMSLNVMQKNEKSI